MPAVSRASRDLLPWFLGALAIVLTFLCAWLTQLCLQLRAENALLLNQQAMAGLELRATRNQLEAERIIAAHEREMRPAGSPPSSSPPATPRP